MTQGQFQEWIARFAELLECDANPPTVAVAIERLRSERNTAVASIGRHRRAAVDAFIREHAAQLGGHVSAQLVTND